MVLGKLKTDGRHTFLWHTPVGVPEFLRWGHVEDFSEPSGEFLPWGRKRATQRLWRSIMWLLASNGLRGEF